MILRSIFTFATFDSVISASCSRSSKLRLKIEKWQLPSPSTRVALSAFRQSLRSQVRRRVTQSISNIQPPFLEFVEHFSLFLCFLHRTHRVLRQIILSAYISLRTPSKLQSLSFGSETAQATTVGRREDLAAVTIAASHTILTPLGGRIARGS